LTIDDIRTEAGMTKASLAERVDRFEERARRNDSRFEVAIESGRLEVPRA
jgi:hypothetical protein